MKFEKEGYPEIVFTCPPSYFLNDLGYFEYHLGVGYIQAYLQEKGITSVQVVQREKINLYDFIEKILSYNPKIVGFTCYDANYYLVKIIAKLLKSRKSRILIIAGGPTPTFSDELILRDCPQIDMCIRGEGEYAVYEIIHFLYGKRKISEIEGITYRRGEKVIKTPDRSLTGREGKKGAELDILPSPYLSNILPAGGSAGILTSRGCTFRCTYCNFASISRYSIRYHSIARVIFEIRKIDKFINSFKTNGNRFFLQFQDDNFNLDINRAKRICEEMVREKFNLEFSCSLRADGVTEELPKLLYLAGFRHINFGLESVVPRVLRNVKKTGCAKNYSDFRLEKNFVNKVKENVKIAKAVGLNPTVSIISGLPGESFRDGKRTLEFVKKLDLTMYYHNHLSIFAGTELFKSHKKFNLKIWPSEYILPYEVKHSYNVNRIPYENNSYQSRLAYIRSHYFTDAVLGLHKDDKLSAEIDRVSPFIVFNDIQIMDNRFLRWLAKIMPVAGKLFFVYRHNISAKAVSRKIKQMISNDIPTKECYFLSYSDRARGDSKVKIYKLFFKDKPRPFKNPPFIFNFIPLSRVYKNNLARANSDIIITLDDRDDLVYFKNLIKMTEDNPSNALLDNIVNLNATFEEACKWSDKSCPALNPAKLIIEKDKSIRPCRHAAPIGKVGDSLQEIIKRLNQKFVLEKNRRKCQYCPVEDVCSKCLYPYPIAAEEYCRIKRNFSRTATVMKLLSNLKYMELQNPIGFLNKEGWE